MNNKNSFDAYLLTRSLLSKTKQDDSFLVKNYRYLTDDCISCQLAIYKMVIQDISNGLSLEEIFNKIDNLELDTYLILKEDYQEWIKNDVKNILILRKNKEKKGMMK